MPVLLLTDDTAARLAAKSLGVAAHGTIGLLIRAARKQHRSPAAVVELLSAIPKRSTLHIRPTLLEDVIDQLRRTWEL
jgi:predicted nucleic acid-binding protein